MNKIITALALLGFSTLALAADAVGATEKQATNWHAIIMFCIFVALTMGITYWAASRTKTTADFYTACLLYTSPSPRDRTRSRMPSSA